MTTSKDKTIEVLGQERRRRWSVEEKLAMVRESLEPGQSVSTVRAGEAVVPASEQANAITILTPLNRSASTGHVLAKRSVTFTEIRSSASREPA